MVRPSVVHSINLCVVCVSASVCFSTSVAHAEDERRTTVVTVQNVIDELRGRLSIPVEVTATMVRGNPLLVSVEPLTTRPGVFVLSVEDGFLDTLDDDEIRAVVAHELGHVWIFTHHPYLQTERLANDVAMRAVTRDSLQQVYGKVWERTGLKGDLERFLGK